jgi:hypothetical protein
VAERAAFEALELAGRSAAALASALDPSLAEPWRRGDPSPSARQRDAEARLESVRAAIDRARADRDASALERGGSAAREVARDFDELRAEAQRLRSEQGARVGGLRKRVEGLAATARALLRGTSDLAPYPPQLRRRRADLESLLAEVDGPAANRTDGYLEGLASRLSFSTRQLEEVAARPPEVLTAAAESFFAGDYAAVLAGLATLPSDARARAHALLLRSAAGYYLWVEQGESDPALLAAASADAAECQTVDAGPRPPATLFSPRFVEFFASAAPSEQP